MLDSPLSPTSGTSSPAIVESEVRSSGAMKPQTTICCDRDRSATGLIGLILVMNGEQGDVMLEKEGSEVKSSRDMGGRRSHAKTTGI